ncbi:MAG TPA: hypothetical protein PK737_02880 [Bacilli bacterium]|nr:hypothetical protein [Bacilli bacterium]
MYETIKALISGKKPDMTELTLAYFTNYFYVLNKRKAIPEGSTLEALIDNALIFANKVEFYDQDHWVYQNNGPDTKGYRDLETKGIYIRNNLPQPLKEMVFYHELHHATQTNVANGEVGLNQESNLGRMIMEAQTQWFAEEVYKEIHQVDYQERVIPTGNLRMQPGGVIISNLHNYEMYDSLLSKLAIIFQVPKEFFVLISFLYQDNKGLEMLEARYQQLATRYKYKYDFNKLLYYLDYIYVVDLMAYIANEDKAVILSGQETAEVYEIHSGAGNELSLKKQYECITNIDLSFFVDLFDNGGDYQSFSKYIMDNKTRKMVNDFVKAANKVAKQDSKLGKGK